MEYELTDDQVGEIVKCLLMVNEQPPFDAPEQREERAALAAELLTQYKHHFEYDE